MEHGKQQKLRISSYFNTVNVGDGSSLLYNGLTSRIDLIPSKIARKLADSSGWRGFSFLSSEERQHLVKRGHLTGLTVRGELEEFKKLAEHISRANDRMDRRKAGKRAVTFILTYQCNLSCTYCYQDELRQKRVAVPPMDEAFVEEFFRVYLRKLFPDCRGKYLSLLLFGGEPLLPGNRRTIEKILNYAKKHSSAVAVATNGLMLPQMLDLIGPEPGKIQGVQMTLDGDRTFHDRKRVPKSGAPTFDEMIRSMRELMKMKVSATVRIHLHPDGLESSRALTDYLEHEGILGHPRVNVYFDPIFSSDGSDVSLPYLEQFSDVFARVALVQDNPPSQFARRFGHMMASTATKAVLKTRYCSVGTGLLRVVDAQGDVYDCYEEAGNTDRRIAKLSGGEVTYFKLRDTYERRHILNMPHCLKCSVALYCGGGCVSQAHQNKGSIFKPFCQQNKDFIANTLKAYYLLNQDRKAEPTNAI